MLIPLWLPWAVVAALVLTGLFATLERRGERGREGGRGAGPVFLARTWSAALVAVAVAAVLTLDRQQVDDDELLEAVAASAAAADGTLGNVSLARVAQGATDRLGREVTLSAAGQRRAAPVERVDTYEARLVGQDDGPVACLQVSVSRLGPDPTLGLVSLDVARGAC